MEQIALIVNNTYIYWSAVIRALAAAAAVCCFWALAIGRGKALAAAVAVPGALVLSVILSRLCHDYFRPGQTGDYALMGAFAGCFLAAAGVRLLGLTKNLPELLDCMSIAGALGMAVGRQACWFNAADRGMLMASGRGFPWVVEVTNSVTGRAEFRLAVFLFQSAAAGVLFLGLLLWYLGSRKIRRDGDVTLVFLLCHGASQVLLDSMRYDSLYFRSNGFVSAVQVLGALAVAWAAAVFGFRLVRRRGWRHWYVFLCQAGCFALAGYMEYYVQRHGVRAGMAYSMMALALAGILGLTLVTRRLGRGAYHG